MYLIKHTGGKYCTPCTLIKFSYNEVQSRLRRPSTYFQEFNAESD